jgi:hypothetical protein
MGNAVNKLDIAKLEKAVIKCSIRQRITLQLFIGSIVLVVLSVITSLVMEASEPMMAVTFASCLFTILPILALLEIRKHRFLTREEFLASPPETPPIGPGQGVRAMGIIFGMLMLLFTLGSALTAYEIYEPDIPGGIILAFSGFLALGGAAVYPTRIDYDFAHVRAIIRDPPAPPPIERTEIIHQTEIVVKIRCRYCGNTFDEKLDQCSVCGARK